MTLIRAIEAVVSSATPCPLARPSPEEECCRAILVAPLVWGSTNSRRTSLTQFVDFVQT